MKTLVLNKKSNLFKAIGHPSKISLRLGEKYVQDKT